LGDEGVEGFEGSDAGDYFDGDEFGGGQQGDLQGELGKVGWIGGAFNAGAAEGEQELKAIAKGEVEEHVFGVGVAGDIDGEGEGG